MSTIPQMTTLFQTNGSDAFFHRADSTIPCPCRTPEGFRDPFWHLAAPPGTPVCNAEGMLPDPAHTVALMVKAFVQPIQSTRATRLQTEYLEQMFGGIEADDHLGIFPVVWGGQVLDFRNWSQSGEDYIEYDGQRFFVVNANKIPDPGSGSPDHHWEVGIRLISGEELVY